VLPTQIFAFCVLTGAKYNDVVKFFSINLKAQGVYFKCLGEEGLLIRVGDGADLIFPKSRPDVIIF